jgi:tetratricopeptide (TPR) repeat protein
MQRFLFLVTTALALMLTACMEPAETGAVSDDKNPFLKKAENEMQQRNYAPAADYYEKALQLNPASQKAHWAAAMVYEQHLNDFASAIYHYQRFVQLKPETARIKMANEFIERAKYSMATSLPNTPVEGASEFKQLQDKTKALQDENDSLHQRLTEAEMKLANQPRVTAMTTPMPLDPVTPDPQQVPTTERSTPAVQQKLAVATPTANPPPDTTPPPIAKTKLAPKPSTTGVTRTGTYTVKRGDTLSSIAERFYGDRGAWTMIYRANKSAIPDKDRLLTGTVLTIPAKRSH